MSGFGFGFGYFEVNNECPLSFILNFNNKGPVICSFFAKVPVAGFV